MEEDVDAIKTIEENFLDFCFITFTEITMYPMGKACCSFSRREFLKKAWTWKTIIPTTISTSSCHALSGATTYVTSSESNPASGKEGDNFSFSFYNRGYKAFSYKVENLPDGLVYNNSINGPKISGIARTEIILLTLQVTVIQDSQVIQPRFTPCN